METRKETLTALKLCRFCLSQDETLTSLYDRSRAPKNSVPLSLKILSCVSVEVFPSDRMPAYICNRCKFFMDISYEYKQMCRQADENILQYIQSGTNLNSMTWPSSLQKLFRVATKAAPELAIMKTVVEGGATVQVTAQESDSEEEDDENVYNVKIGDGTDDGPKNARVKVITADKSANRKLKQTKDSEDERSGSPPRVFSIRPNTDHWQRAAPTDLKDGCWPCDLCDCTYPLKQLLNLHKMNKHRERTEQCKQCDAKFFSPYDLATHQQRHNTDDAVFQCAACGKQFKRLILLKRHEKLVHADLAQIACPSCPATFLSQEELDAHEEKHALNRQKRFVCDICDKRFHEKSTLHRHKANVHEKEDAFACVYCPARFPSVSKLTRHVRAHAGDRSYPCKYCEKSFIKSHHYTRHLRLKHRETIRTCRGPFGEMDQYRCEQCEDTFNTQDELIYHSAIHATQNLICPLCQEKFEDVDAVTAHIKSHVNGTEFMCDLCELVFTSKEKLDNHISNAHDDEISKEDLAQDESSMEMEMLEDDEDDTGINVKEEDDHMVVEIKKADDFMLTNLQGDGEDKIDNTNSEESDSEINYTDISNVDTITMTRKDTAKVPEKTSMPGGATITKTGATIIPIKAADKHDNQTAPILRRAEEIKRKAQPTSDTVEKKNKVETNNTGASDKSLRLLEKELQELKRTNTRSEVIKTPAKSVETLRNRRPQIHTSTPKIRTPVVEEKKAPVTSRSPALEKKLPERRIVTKENKEPKEAKGNNGNVKEEKEIKEKEMKEKEVKEKEKEREVKEKEKEVKESPKTVVKNGASEKSTAEEGIRRSTRPSKIKDYAKMIRDRTQDSDDDEDSDEVDEEYKEADKSTDSRSKSRRTSIKAPARAAPPPAPAPAPAGTPPAPRKRGRPRKDASLTAASTPAKVKKEEVQEPKHDESDKESENTSKENADNSKEQATAGESSNVDNKVSTEGKPAGVLVSPTGQTLKKIPIKALPPGVKPLPLPVNARPMAGGEVCEMQIGKKVVKVQKIVMTKAEVEAMAKKGLVEMKDGTMVLKQGIKIPSSDPSAIKSLVGDDAAKESNKKDKATPTRCDIDDDSTT